MARHNKPTPEERYRSTVLTYLCRFTQARGIGFRELPEPTLSRLGAEVIELGNRCRTLLVNAPSGPFSQETRSMLEDMERFIAGRPSKKNGKGEDRRDRKARQEKAGFEGMDALAEGILTTITPRGHAYK